LDWSVAELGSLTPPSWPANCATRFRACCAAHDISVARLTCTTYSMSSAFGQAYDAIGR